MKREEIDSLFVPIFDQIYDLIDGQIKSVLANSDNARAKTKVIMYIETHCDFRPFSWLGGLGQMSICPSICGTNCKVE